MDTGLGMGSALRTGLGFVLAPMLFGSWVVANLSSAHIWFLVLLGVAFLIAVVWPAWDYYEHGRHARHYKKFAERHGWTYEAASRRYTHRFDGYPFNLGNERHQLDVLTGTLNGVDCATFTYAFKPDSQGRTGEVKQVFQVTLVEIPARFPRLDLLPENTATRVLGRIDGFDIDMESYQFNRRWRVKSANRRFAHDFLDPRMLERLIWADTEGMALRVEGGAILMWQYGRRGTDDLAHRLGVLTGIARRVPPHLVRRFIEAGLESTPGDAATRPLHGPAWATTPGALTSGRYTGIGADPEAPPGDGGALDWQQDWDGRWDDERAAPPSTTEHRPGTLASRPRPQKGE